MNNEQLKALENIKQALLKCKIALGDISDQLVNLTQLVEAGSDLLEQDNQEQSEVSVNIIMINDYNSLFINYSNRLKDALKEYTDNNPSTNLQCNHIDSQTAYITDLTRVVNEGDLIINKIASYTVKGDGNPKLLTAANYEQEIPTIIPTFINFLTTRIQNLQTGIGDWGDPNKPPSDATGLFKCVRKNIFDYTPVYEENELVDQKEIYGTRLLGRFPPKAKHGNQLNFYDSYGAALINTHSKDFAKKVLKEITTDHTYDRLLISVNSGDVWNIRSNKFKWWILAFIGAYIGGVALSSLIGVGPFVITALLYPYLPLFLVTLGGWGLHVLLSARSFNSKSIGPKSGKQTNVKIFERIGDWKKWLDLQALQLVIGLTIVFALFMVATFYFAAGGVVIDVIPCFTIGIAFDRLWETVKQRLLDVSEEQLEKWGLI